MPLRSKPQQHSASVDERRINELIEKGGTVAAGKRDNPSDVKLVQLRLPSELIQQIDTERKKRTVPPSRHSWILEALLVALNSKQ
jgi:hypothetical protein